MLYISYKTIKRIGYISVFYLCCSIATFSVAEIVPVSTEPPANLARTNTPQFICITFDDAVNDRSWEWVQQISDHLQADGSPVPLTFFVSLYYTDYWLVHFLHAAGHEIAVHTITHPHGVPNSFKTWVREIEGARECLSRYADIPVEEIRGFRAPYLEFSPAQFDALAALDFDYDCSISEKPGTQPGNLSSNGSTYIWPYTLQDGVKQICDSKGVPPTNSLPSLMEIPMWDLNEGDTHLGMDPPGSYEYLLSLFKTNLVERYNGNRVPLCIWLHPGWLEDSNHVQALNEFLDWSLAIPDVHAISLSMLNDWMHSPCPASEININQHPEFIAQTNEPMPEAESEECLFRFGDGDENRGFRTCGERPPVYPQPENAFQRCLPVDGVTVEIIITQDWGTGFMGKIIVDHQKEQPLCAWTIDFAPGDYSINSLWGKTSYCTNNGTIHIYPGNHLAEIPAGRTEFAEFSGSGDFSTIGTPQYSFYLPGYEQPTLNLQMGSNSTSCLLNWDRRAIGYQLQQRLSLLAGSWETVTTYYGDCQADKPIITDQIFYRLKCIY